MSCDCDGLPAPDSRVQWSNMWSTARYSPDGEALAVTGWEKGVGDKLHVVEWDPDGRERRLDPPDWLTWPRDRGAWSEDGRAYAHVFAHLPSTLVLLDRTTGAWRPVATIEHSQVSSPVWNPESSEIAFAEAASKAWIRDPLDPDGGHARPPMLRVAVIDRDGALQRECSITAIPTAGMPPSLAWSPDGRFLALACEWDESRPGEPFVKNSLRFWLLDARSLRLIEARTIDGLHTEAVVARWSPDSRQIVLVSEGGLKVIDMAEIGGLGEESLTRIPGLLDAAWCPDGTQLLLYTRIGDYDLREAFETIMGAGHAPTKRSRYGTWFCDPWTHQLMECTSRRHIGRERWMHPWMISGTAEAFARWSR